MIMERGLYRTIMNPAMITVWILGPLTLLSLPAGILGEGWLHAKLLLVLLLTGFHHMLGRWRKDFAADRNRKPARFYKRVNEIPTVILILVVLLVVLKPF
jgi:protoporphyrinogen IX oxidase